MNSAYVIVILWKILICANLIFKNYEIHRCVGQDQDRAHIMLQLFTRKFTHRQDVELKLQTVKHIKTQTIIEWHYKVSKFSIDK